MSLTRFIAAALALGTSFGAALAAPDAPADQAVQAVAVADNRLGIELFRRLAATPGNIVLSPHGIASAMAMTLEGARGTTAQELAAALNSDPAADAPADARGRLGQMLADPGQGATVRVANALMLPRPDGFSPAFKTLLTERYGAELFAGADLNTINGWVKQRTEGRIDKILSDLNPNAVGVILNAIYFKGAWQDGFDKRLTRPEDFHLTASDSASVDTMHRVGEFQVLRGTGFDAIRLPYRDSRLAMIVMLPPTDAKLASEAGIDAASAAATLAGLSQATASRVELSLPRFKIDFQADLVPPFRDLGVKLAFDADGADFSGMTGDASEAKRIHISRIAHRATIDVDETGTEAAAATAVEMSTRSMGTKPAAFKVDRPFLYMIADEASGAILFVGRVMDPRGTAAN